MVERRPTLGILAHVVLILGVLVVGLLSVFDSELFPSDTVWSVFGRGYLFSPLVIPVLGMIWLACRSSERAAERT